MADQAYERTGRMPSGQKYLKWYIHPGPPEKDYDYYNSDGPWAFGPENEKGRFWIEHTELGKVIIEKSRGGVSPMGQDTIENVS